MAAQSAVEEFLELAAEKKSSYGTVKIEFLECVTALMHTLANELDRMLREDSRLVSVQDAQRRTALHLACSKGNLESVKVPLCRSMMPSIRLSWSPRRCS